MLPTNKTAAEILEYLKTKLELPDNIISISLHMAVDELVTVTCTFHPVTKKGSE
jgi:hypothetical protein